MHSDSLKSKLNTKVRLHVEACGRAGKAHRPHQKNMQDSERRSGPEGLMELVDMPQQT